MSYHPPKTGAGSRRGILPRDTTRLGVGEIAESTTSSHGATNPSTSTVPVPMAVRKTVGDYPNEKMQATSASLLVT